MFLEMSNNGKLNRVENARIAIIGLGYVGLPLAIEFAKKYDTLGFDINETRVNELSKGKDRTQEASIEDLKKVISSKDDKKCAGLKFSSIKEDLKEYNTFIVTVPTPIDNFKAPDLRPLLKASEMLGSILKAGDIVIYESTVYPGCTEEDCVPVLEAVSGLKFNKDFFVGYSPERINPGDKINTLTKIKKVTSGSTPEIACRVDDLYRSIIDAGTHKAPSIKVAEASKAIENAQRDVNISFVNELALIFDRIGIDTNDVIEAAGTKWNFLKYKPGLVGGHCIGVDPYYLAHKAESLGYHPQVILSGRRVNDHVGHFVANKVVKLMIEKDHKIKGSKALIMGITFKENCPDVRNTRVVDIYHELKQFGLDVDIYDPWADIKEVKHEYDVDVLNQLDKTTVYDAIIVAVAHNEFLNFDYQKIKRNNGVIFDTKACLDRSLVDARL
jgi:UDP-N-acetyl-D-galactosamine dehydrogenase